MQKYEEKPIPVVFRHENSKYEVNPEALELFSSVEGKLAIISVAGIYRTGKSFLLNTMLLNCKNGFAVGPTVNPKTKGIWVWGKPLIFKNESDEIINVFVLDSEGLGSTEEDANHDLRLFSITLLLSSAFMYNTVGAIDENAIDRLGLVLRLCEHLKNDNFNDFPDFYWILRDFSLALVDKNNDPLTTKDYLENCLSNQSGDSEYRNLIRQAIKQAFEARNCYTFVRPLLNEESLQSLDKMELEELRPEFVEQVIDFRKSIFGNLRIKSIKGRDINGNMLCELIKIYVECINSDKLPVIESGWEQLCLKELHEVLFDIEEAIAKRVREMKERLPRTKKELLKEQQMLMEEFQEIFSKRLRNNDKAKEYFKSVEEIITKELQGIEEEMKVKNTSENQNFLKREFEGIEKRLKQSEFKSMGQLAKEFEIFYEYYKKKCPYKDELETGHEMLMKKFSECSLIFFKNAQNKKDSEIELLKQEMNQIIADFNGKEEKYREEKNKFQDLNTKLETNLSDLKKQNDEMSNMIEELEGKLQISENMNNNNMDEDISHQNILLKKKIMDLEDKQRELDCVHSQELSVLRQEILLKNNQNENYEKLKCDLTEKISELELMYRNCKEANEQKINELLQELDNTSKTGSNIEKVLKSKLSEKEHMIDELEKTIETKNEEILEISNRMSNENSLLAEMTMQEERKVLQEREKEMRDLQTEYSQVKETLEKRVDELTNEISTKETDFRIWKLELEQSKALLSQKIEFITKQIDEKKDKNNTLQEEITNYVQMIEEKDEQIQELTNEIEDLKNYELTEGEQIEKKIAEFIGQLEIKNNQIKSLENLIDNTTATLNKKIDEKTFKIEETQVFLDKSEEECRVLQNKIAELKNVQEEWERNSEDQLESNRIQYQKDIEEQKRAAELSLCQLKNYFEMEKERLEKRILEERKKSEYNENNLTFELKNKYTKEIKNLTDQNNEFSERIEELEEDLIRIQNEYEIKFIGQDEEIENEKRAFENRFEALKRKYEETSEELSKIEKKHEEDRITFVKKIEALSFEISKKEKEVFELGKKKESLENTINKKDSQIESIKKIMNQEIESSLKKVSETQEKYQRVNEEYVKYRMDAEKQNALLNQKNEFLNAKLDDISKEKESGSMKNIEKIEKNKIAELKEQLERQKSENVSLEAKIENLRKTEKESSNNHKKEYNEIEKENLILKQKVDIYETRIGELEIKINQKTEQFKKEVEEMRIKFTADRSKLQNDVDLQKEKLFNSDEEKNQKIFKLQMDLALIQDKMIYAESQRDQNKKDLEETEKRLQNALNQAKKQNDKGLDMNQNKKHSVDKRYSNQLELMKISSKVRQEELEETNRKMKDEIKSLKDKNFELQEKLNMVEKSANQEKNLSEEIYQLKREKEQLVMAHRNEFAKESDDNKKRFLEIERRNRELDSKNNRFVFELEKEKAKANLEKNGLLEKLKELEDQLAWEKKKSEPQNRAQTSKSKLISMSSSDVMGNYK